MAGETIILYAIWSDISFNEEDFHVIYMPNGGTGRHEDGELLYGTDYTVRGESDTGISWTGHSFKGWNTQSDGSGAAYVAGDTITITEDVALYAQWQIIAAPDPDPDVYNVTYDANGGTGSHTDTNLEYESGYAVLGRSDTGISRDGYTFTGWNTQPNGTGTPYTASDTITITGDVTLYAQWDAEPILAPTYTVTYDANGGTGSYADTDLASGSGYTVKGQSGTGISRDGYTFTGWNMQPNGTGTSYAAGSTITIIGDVILYARWERISNPGSRYYTVNYDANGGTGSHADTGLTSGSDYTVKGQSTTGISRNGYTFVGWNTAADGNSTSYAASVIFTITGNVTLYAQWKKDPATSYTVNYDANGGTGSHSDTGLIYGSSYTVLGRPATGITRNGYTFKGWDTAADGSGTSYAAGGIFTITGNVTLYAQWKKDPVASYTVNYDANGGTGSHSDTGLTYGSSYTVLGRPTTGITRNGYTFKGWNTAADGSGTSYVPGDIFIITSDVTLYAQWEKTSSGGTISTSGDASGGTMSASSKTRFSRTSSFPNTGDTSNIGLWITLLCISLAGEVYALWAVRRRKRHR